MKETFKIKIVTTIPNVIVHIHHGNGSTVAKEEIGGALIPHFSKNYMDVFSRENSKEIELPKGLYSMRVYLPYCNRVSNDGKSGPLYEMPIIMDEFLTLNQDLEYRIDLAFTYPGKKRDVIRKQVNENFE